MRFGVGIGIVLIGAVLGNFASMAEDGEPGPLSGVALMVVAFGLGTLVYATVEWLL